MLTHDQCEALLREDDGSPALTEHLAGCAQCQAYQRKLSALDDLLRLDVDEEPSAGFDARVLAAIKPAPFWKRPFVLAPAMAAALGLCVVFVLPRAPGDDEFSMIEDAEMLADMDMLRDLDAVEDFAVIAALEDK